MNEYEIKEEGQNGTVVLLEGKLVRTIKKHMRRDDEQTIFVKAITDVSLNRRAMGADIITLTLGNAKTYVWKTKHAEELAKLIEDAVCGVSQPVNRVEPVTTSWNPPAVATRAT